MFRMKKNYQKDTALENLAGRARLAAMSIISKSALPALAVALVTLMGGSSALAWGPNRPTFTMESPAPYVTFNSISADTSWGDERNFALIKDVNGQANNGATAKSGGFSDVANYVDGHTYMVKMFIHNNAAANFNLMSKNTRAMVYAPTASGNSAMIQGIIGSDSCGANKEGNDGQSCTFWDEAYIKGQDSDKFKVSYVAGSAKYYNNKKMFDQGGFSLGDSIVSMNGVKVGYEAMDGNVQGCFQYSGYLTFLIKATADNSGASFTIDKKARIVGSTEWLDKVDNAKPGDVIEYSIEYKNTGNTNQTNVVIKDSMAKNASVVNGGAIEDNVATGLTFINGSTKLKNGNNPNGLTMNNDKWVSNGLNVGTYTANSNAIVYYSAKVPDSDKLHCGSNKFDNVALVSTGEAGAKIDSTTVTVNKECQPKPENPSTPKPKPGAPAAGYGQGASIVIPVLVAVTAIGLLVIAIRHKARK